MDPLTTIFTRTEVSALTTEEKLTMREKLRAYIALRPIRPQKLFGFVRTRYARKFVAVSATVCSLLLSAAGVSYAAEGAMPGDTLYPVKVHVNEEVHAVLLVTAKDRANWEATRAERRLAEAETLQSSGRLQPRTSENLAVQFRAHAANAERKMAALRANADAVAASDVRARLAVTLRTHEKILHVLHAEKDTQKEKDERASLEHIVAVIDEETKAIEGDRHEADVVKKNFTRSRAILRVETHRAAAQRKIDEVRTVLGSTVGLDVDASARIEAQLSLAGALLVKGDAAVAEGRTEDAFAFYTKARAEAQKAKRFITTKKLRIQKDVVPQTTNASSQGEVIPPAGESTEDVRIDARGHVRIPSLRLGR